MRWQWSLRDFLVLIAAAGCFFSEAHSGPVFFGFSWTYRAPWSALTLVLVVGMLNEAFSGATAYRRLPHDTNGLRFAAGFRAVFLLFCSALLIVGHWRLLTRFGSFRLPEDRLNLNDAMQVTGAVLGITAVRPPLLVVAGRRFVVCRVAFWMIAVLAVTLSVLNFSMPQSLVFLGTTGSELAQPTVHNGVKFRPLLPTQAIIDQCMGGAAAAGTSWLLMSGAFLGAAANWSAPKRRLKYFVLFSLCGLVTAGLDYWWITAGVKQLWPLAPPLEAPLLAQGYAGAFVVAAALYFGFRICVAGRRDELQSRSAAAIPPGFYHRSPLLVLAYIGSFCLAEIWPMSSFFGALNDAAIIPGFFISLLFVPSGWLMIALLVDQVQLCWARWRRTEYSSAFDLPLAPAKLLSLCGMVLALLTLATPLAGWTGMAMYLALGR